MILARAWRASRTLCAVGDTMKRKAVAVLAAVLALVVALYGWGHEGHRIVADIAILEAIAHAAPEKTLPE